MESELSPDKESKESSLEPINEYQWDDLRRDRKLGRYPWTHLLKPPLEGEITAEDIIRETTPRRSMSREFSRSRTHSPVDGGGQKILNLDSSPGSSRRHGEEGEDEGVHVPNFSKEVSLDSEDDAINQAANDFINKQVDNQTSSHLEAPVTTPKNVSPKGILKRRVPDRTAYIGVVETREKTKCCHPLVNKIKHLADKTLHKLEKNEGEKSPLPKRKKNKEGQEIRQLKSSPGAVRRQKFSAIKLGDSDEMSKTMSVDTPPPRKKKEHIYEDIEVSKKQDREKTLQFSTDTETDRENSNKENESFQDRKSLASQDPSLVVEDEASLKSDEHIMEKLYKVRDSNKEAILLDEEMDPEEPNVEEIFQTQLDETRPKNDSPNITITEIFDDDIMETSQGQAPVPIEISPSPSPQAMLHKKNSVEISEKEWSKPSSDHEYEIIGKPPPNIVFTTSTVGTKASMVKTDDELSSTTSLERKYLQHPSDEEEQQDDKENEGIMNAELLQKDIEERYFVNTPSTMSRTECEISTSQVDSSALENLPLKRDSRQNDRIDAKIQQRLKEGAEKLKSQAGKLKTKLQSMKMPEKPKITLPERPKFKMPERPKFALPDRPKFTLPDKRKFSLPDRPKFKKINLSEKLSFGDKKKFTLPERPKFNVPDFPKFKMPERTKINFSSLGRKKSNKPEDSNTTGSSSDIRNVVPVEFEAKTYPRLFSRKKKSELPKTSSSPNLDREETPPATFTFTRMKKQSTQPSSYIPDSPSEPREYGNTGSFDAEINERQPFEATYDFDKLDSQYLQDEGELSHLNEQMNDELLTQQHSPDSEEYSHVINEINNDEFFVRPRGISRENIQVREYLSDEIRQAFKIPKNALALMGSHSGVNDENVYANEPEADPELMLDDNMRYSTEDLNDRDDGYYTFPPVRPSRAKRKKKEEMEAVQYIDENMETDTQFSEIDLGLTENQMHIHSPYNNIENDKPEDIGSTQLEFCPPNELRSIHEYANDDVIQYPEDVPIQSQTLPMPPQRKKKFGKKDSRYSSLNDFKDIPTSEIREELPVQKDDIIVYRTEHEYVVPQSETTVTEHSPLPPRRNRSRSSRGTSLCDDDRTSHGAESLTMDTNLPPIDYIESDKHSRYESPGYATVDKSACAPNKSIRRSRSKTPPVRRRKSNSSERKYYTVEPVSRTLPDRPPRKKSSTSLMTLNSFSKRSVSGDLTQYVEIDEPQLDEVHKDLISGEVVNKMKDRPLPPPPRPPRGPKRRKSDKSYFEDSIDKTDIVASQEHLTHADNDLKTDDVVEIEVSTQTDPLPDDVDFELGMEENFDISMSSSLRDIANEDPYRSKSHSKVGESPRISRPTSRSEKSFKLSDPKISELSKPNIGRTSPTVILVERRVSSPTRINERDEMLTEASLTVQQIDIDEAHIPDVPPLPRPKNVTKVSSSPRKIVSSGDEQALERVTDASRDVQLDNLITQRLQVRDLDVGRLNVSELQASKILVSDIEGMTLQVTELDSKSGHISVSGIEFSQSVIDEIVKKFAEISTSATASQVQHELLRPGEQKGEIISREEQTQTDPSANDTLKTETKSSLELNPEQPSTLPPSPPPPPPKASNEEEATRPPQRPPPPDLTPLLYSYLQDITMPPASYYHRPAAMRERPFTEFHDAQYQSPPPPTRRAKRRPAAPHSESSSDELLARPSPRRMQPPVRAHEPTITEAGANFLRVCHNSISRTIRSIFNSFVSYISGTEDKKDVQMALVIFLVLIAGLIMFGLSDSRTIHHHHWEFFNPPDGKQ